MHPKEITPELCVRVQTIAFVTNTSYPTRRGWEQSAPVAESRRLKGLLLKRFLRRRETDTPLRSEALSCLQKKVSIWWPVGWR